MEQRTEEWFQARCGKVTASRVADVIAKTKSGWGASRKNYMAQLVCERLTNTCAPSFTNSAMEWGTRTEPQARECYEAVNLTSVVEVGFVDHPKIAMSGASPDGLVEADGLIEIKCPNSATHIDTLRTKTIPQKYITQMQWQMSCTDRQWCDFFSFDPRLPEGLQSVQIRVGRDNDLIADISKMVIDFIIELDEAILELKQMQEINK